MDRQATPFTRSFTAGGTVSRPGRLAQSAAERWPGPFRRPRAGGAHKRWGGALLLLLLAWLIVDPFAAWAQGTPDEAKALAERAAAHMQQVGAQQAIADFNDPDGGYCDRNLFVVTYDQQRKVVSSLRVPAYLGRDARRFLDDDGKAFGKAIITMAETYGAGWVDYRMTNPATMKVELKSSYVIAVGDDIVMVGAYKP